MPEGDVGVDMATHDLIQKPRMTQTATSTWTEQAEPPKPLCPWNRTLDISLLKLVEPSGSYPTPGAPGAIVDEDGGGRRGMGEDGEWS
jgi:hypothetical protein